MLIINIIYRNNRALAQEGSGCMVLTQAKIGQRVQIKQIAGNDKVKRFLLTLGCSAGEEITLVSRLSDNYVVNVKDSRYAIDGSTAKLIELI